MQKGTKPAIKTSGPFLPEIKYRMILNREILNVEHVIITRHVIAHALKIQIANIECYVHILRHWCLKIRFINFVCCLKSKDSTFTQGSFSPDMTI